MNRSSSMNAINSERAADVRPQRRRLRKAATDWTCEIFVPDGYGDFEDEGDDTDNDNDNGDDGGGDGNDGGDGYGDGGGTTNIAERAGDYGGDAGHECGVHAASQPSWSEGSEGQSAGLNEGVGAYPYATDEGNEPFEETPHEPYHAPYGLAGLTGLAGQGGVAAGDFAALGRAAPGGGVIGGVYGGSSGEFMDAPEEVVVGEGLGVVGLVEK